MKNQYLIDINQDYYGQQIDCIVGCDDEATDYVHIYSGKFVNSTTKEGAIVVLVVNWDDENTATTELDLVSYGLANTVTDKCTTTDLWTGDSNDHYAVKQTYADIAPHSHVAKKIKCLPF